MGMSFSRQNLKEGYFRLRNRLKFIGLERVKRKEIKDIYYKNPLLKEFRLTDYLSNKIILFWKKLGFKVDIMWHRVFISINGIEDYRYIPEDIFYAFIEPNLNRKDLYYAYVDKNNYDRLFLGVKTPKTILRNINGKYYDVNYERVEFGVICELLKKYSGNYIVKPSLDSGGGKKVMKLQSNSQKDSIDGKCVSFENIENIFKRDFLIQENLEQHPILNNIYPFSLNTFRVITLRINNDIHVLQTIMKFGNCGAYVDNMASGGIACGINNNGRLNQFALDKYYKKFYKHPDTGSSFENIQIPQFSSVLNFVKNLHRYLLYFDMASWDVALNKNGNPVLIEVNLMYQGFNLLQAINGPLFGNFTEQVLEENLERN